MQGHRGLTVIKLIIAVTVFGLLDAVAVPWKIDQEVTRGAYVFRDRVIAEEGGFCPLIVEHFFRNPVNGKLREPSERRQPGSLTWECTEEGWCIIYGFGFNGDTLIVLTTKPDLSST